MPMLLVIGFLSGCLWAVNGDFDQSQWQFDYPIQVSCLSRAINCDSSAKVSVSMREQIKEMMLAVVRSRN